MKKLWSSLRLFAVALAAALPLAACGDAVTGAGDGASPLSIRFGTASGASAYLAPGTFSHNAEHDSLVIEGSNGTLTVTDVRLIVAEFELDRADDDDCDAVEDDDACEKFEAAPAFLDLPLSGGSALAVEQSVPADRYDELEFEVEDLDDDEEDPELRRLISELEAEITQEFPDWPRKASVLATGRFAPANGDAPRDFRVFFEAEIEIEREFSPPLDLTDGPTSPAVTVRVDPAVWFEKPDGTVMDLSTVDGELIEFEVEIEDGFREIEFDD